MGRGRPTAPETRDGARQKDVAVRTAGHPTPQRTRRGTARHTAETRQMDDNRRAVKLPRFEKTPNPRDQGPTRARENKAEGKGAGGAPRPPEDRRRGGARRRPAAGELVRRKAPGAARGCRPRWTSGGPQHLTICTITRIVLDTWPLPGARDWGRRRAEGPPCPGRWRTGEAALQTRPARGWPVSLTVMNHGRGLAQEGPGCRAGGWGTNTRQEGGREGREGRRASDRTEHGLGTPQPKDGATGTGDKQDCAWTGVTEAAGNEAGVPRGRSAVRVTRCQKLRAPAVTAKGVSRHCRVSPGQLLPGEGTSTSEVREADTPRAGSHRELPGGGRGVRRTAGSAVHEGASWGHTWAQRATAGTAPTSGTEGPSYPRGRP